MNLVPRKFYELNNSNRIWAIGSIHGNLYGLKKIHNHIFDSFNENDSIVYLGNVIGVGDNSAEVIDEIMNFRVSLMAKYEIDFKNFVFLRGAQEEMWLKLLELQISPNPKEIITWMFNHGVNETLRSYKIDQNEILNLCDSSTILISKWTTKVKDQIKLFEGHNDYFSNLFHAAFSDTKQILFVNRGVDLSRPLSAQNDCFWWGFHGLSNLSEPYFSFKKIVRGYDPKRLGPKNDTIVCSLYKGSGFGENVVAGLFSKNGDIFDLFEA